MAKNYRASLRKSGASGKKKAPTVFPSARTPALRHNEGAPLSTSSQPCNSTALAPRTFVPVHDLPSQNSRPNGGYCPTVLQPFWSLPCAHSAVRGGFAPLPSMLRPGESSPLQHAATRRHRTQTMQFCQIMGEFFRKVSYFAKESANPVFMRVCGLIFAK